MKQIVKETFDAILFAKSQNLIVELINNSSPYNVFFATRNQMMCDDQTELKILWPGDNIIFGSNIAFFCRIVPHLEP